jgi:hypothetical protein
MRAALVRSILARKPRLRKTRSRARSEVSGPRVKKKLARTPTAARSTESAFESLTCSPRSRRSAPALELTSEEKDSLRLCLFNAQAKILVNEG